MGYELKMFIVDKRASIFKGEKLIYIDDKVETVFPPDKDRKEYIYYPDGNTLTVVPPGTVMLDAKYCSVIGMLDLSKIGDGFTTNTCKFKDSDGCYMYDLDGNTIIGEDDYGSYRSFVPIGTVIKELTVAIKREKEHPYRRFVIALATLKAIKKTFKGSEMGCLFFGH